MVLHGFLEFLREILKNLKTLKRSMDQQFECSLDGPKAAYPVCSIKSILKSGVHRLTFAVTVWSVRKFQLRDLRHEPQASAAASQHVR